MSGSAEDQDGADNDAPVENGAEGDAPSRWPRRADPRLPTIAELRVDPALGIGRAKAAQIMESVQFFGAEIAVFMTDAYRAILAAEMIAGGRDNPHILIRAATAEEALSLYESGIARTPLSADDWVDWRKSSSSEPMSEPGVFVWSGEVLLQGMQGGLCSPFFALEAAAEAWAFHKALSLPAADVCAAQAVAYVCAESFAARLLADSDAEFERLRRYWEPPVRVGSAFPVWLPEREG